MKTLEFETEVSEEHTLKIPPDLAQQVGVHQSVHVILLVDNEDDQGWKRLTAEQFLKGYSDSDAIYDKL